jgi:DNA-binding MarR family transcriptional regulator
MKSVRDSVSTSNDNIDVLPCSVSLYLKRDDDIQVPVFRYWPIPADVLASELSAKAKLLLGLICRHGGSRGRLVGWSLGRMGKHLGLSRRAAQRHRDALVDAGLIDIERSSDPERPDSYQVDMHHWMMKGAVVHIPEGLVGTMSPAALLAYGWVAWRQGTGYPSRISNGELGEALGLTRRSVRRVRAELEAAEFVRCSRLPGGATRFFLLENDALQHVLIEGREVTTALPPVKSAPPPVVTAPPPDTTAPLKDSLRDSLPESLHDSFPPRGRTQPRRASGPDLSRGRGRQKSEQYRRRMREWDSTKKDRPKIGWGL